VPKGPKITYHYNKVSCVLKVYEKYMFFNNTYVDAQFFDW
jgi:hypothetical protein